MGVILCTPRVSTCPQNVSARIHQVRHYHFPIGDVTVDTPDWPASIRSHALNNSTFHQLTNDVTPLGVRIHIGGVGDLKRQSGEGQAGIFGAGPDPEHACISRRPRHHVRFWALSLARFEDTVGKASFWLNTDRLRGLLSIAF
jgi:hypothetical protein